MIYGSFQYKVEVDTTDRVGLRTVVMSKGWQGSRAGMSLAERDAETPDAPETAGGLGEYIGRETRKEGGILRTYWSYQGINGDGRNVTFKGRGASIDYWFTSGYAQVDIALHPNIQELLEKYGGQVIDGQIFFPPTVTIRRGNGATKSGAKPEPNPMFGRTDFLRMEGSYFYRYLSPEVANINARQDKIVTTGSLPGKPPFVEGRNWLVLPAQYQRRGPVHEIVEAYWLSGPGGWPEEVYGNATGSPYTRGGLTTGGLTGGGL